MLPQPGCLGHHLEVEVINLDFTVDCREEPDQPPLGQVRTILSRATLHLLPAKMAVLGGARRPVVTPRWTLGEL